MAPSFRRRSFLQATAGLATGLGAVGSISTASAAENAITISSPAGVSTTIQKYDSGERSGALPEDITAFDSGRLRLADYHTVLWDGDWGVVKNLRDDADSSSISKTAWAPEVSITNEVDIYGTNKFTVQDAYTATVTQDVLVTKDRPALLINTGVDYQHTDGSDYSLGNTHSAYHLLNPEIDDYDSGGAGDEAWVDRYYGYDILAMKDGQWHAAFAREHTRPHLGRGLEQLDKEFEGTRVGVEGVTAGEDESAWHDVYTEADGWIDGNEYNSGDVDAVAGTYLHDDSFHQWDVAIGFGTTYDEAASNATTSLDSGYANELYKYE